MSLTRHGDVRILWGCQDLYAGQELTWTLAGRPDLEAVAGQTIQGAFGPVFIPLQPPPPGPRYGDVRIYE